MYEKLVILIMSADCILSAVCLLLTFFADMVSLIQYKVIKNGKLGNLIMSADFLLSTVCLLLHVCLLFT